MTSGVVEAGQWLSRADHNPGSITVGLCDLEQGLTLSGAEQPHLCNGRMAPPQQEDLMVWFMPQNIHSLLWKSCRKLHRAPPTGSSPCPTFWGLTPQCLGSAHPPHAWACSESHGLHGGARISLLSTQLCPPHFLNLLKTAC